MDATGALRLRHVHPSDHGRVLAAINEWWDDRPMNSRLSPVFFSHFTSTSFVIETDTELVGFLLGHLRRRERTKPACASAGVRPDFRRLGPGRRLYERFFAAARMHERAWCAASPTPGDRLSIAFHLRMGFVPERGDGAVDGLPVRLDYAGKGGHRVVFHRRVAPDIWPAAPTPRSLASTAVPTPLAVIELIDCA